MQEISVVMEQWAKIQDEIKKEAATIEWNEAKSMQPKFTGTWWGCQDVSYEFEEYEYIDVTYMVELTADFDYTSYTFVAGDELFIHSDTGRYGSFFEQSRKPKFNLNSKKTILTARGYGEFRFENATYLLIDPDSELLTTWTKDDQGDNRE